MKTTNVTNNIENKNVSVEITLTFPYKGERTINTQDACEASKCRIFNIIGQFSTHMIKALEARMEACTNNLLNHKDDIIFNNGIMIVYQRKDKTVHSFNIPSYNIMKEAIVILKKGDWRKFCMESAYSDQTLKALYWIEKPEDKSGSFKYSNLVSALLQLHIHPYCD